MPYITDAAREYAKKLAKDSNERFFELLAKNQKRSESEQREFKQLFRPLSFEDLITKGKTIFNEIMSNDIGGHDLPLRQLFNAGQNNNLSLSDYKLIDNAFNNGMTFNEIINQFDHLAKDKWEFNPNMYKGLNVNQSPFSADAIAKIKNILKKGYNAYRQFKMHQTTDSAKDSEDIVESFINMIDAFDKLHHDELAKLFKQHDVDEFTGPTIGSKLLEKYAELLK